MASGKNFRQEKRTSTSYVMATATVFLALCLLGAWILSSPSGSRDVKDSQNASVNVNYNLETNRVAESSESFEDSAGDLNSENEEKPQDTPQQNSYKIDSSESETDQKQIPQENNKPHEKPKAEKEPEETLGDLDEVTDHKNADEAVQKEDLEAAENKDTEKTNSNSGSDTSSVSSVTSKHKEDADLESDGGEQSDLLIETKEETGTWDTQANESKEEKRKVKAELERKQTVNDQSMEDESDADDTSTYSKKKKKKVGAVYDNDIGQKKENDWALCEFDGAIDYIPCLDNIDAIKALPSTKHYEHRERHCPDPAPTCLVPLPDGYRTPIPWPKSRNEVWYSNVPHPGLISYKKDQNWVKKTNDRLIFPGGGTQFKHGALHYIDFIEESFPKISWGKRTRVILDVGCGVASFGGYIFDRDVLTMSLAPKDEHEAQVQLALERGIPAISSVMGTQRLVFPGNVYDAVHCARCRVPWHIEGGKLLLELNRVLRPGGYFVWSATPVYWTDDEDVEIWKEMEKLTRSICWKLVAKFVDESTGIGAAIFRKPTSNDCYENRNKNFPPMCEEDDSVNAAWYVPLSACIHRIPDEDERGSKWPQSWPSRLTEAPAWLNNFKGVNGKTAADDFMADSEKWQKAVEKSYLDGLGIDWKHIRNVMDMRAVYGGFAAALSSLPVWVMNVVPSDAPDTLPVIFDRGLFGIYHDWCESFSSYPRTYDLLHADHLFSKIKKRCNIKAVIAEVDRLLRPSGWVIVREKSEFIGEMQNYFESLRWEVKMAFSKGTEGLVAVQKTKWRPATSF